MPILNFPANPEDGQVYPDPAIPGSTQYVFNAAKGTWLTVMMGVAAVAGTPPIQILGTENYPIVTMPPVSPQRDGYMTIADKRKLDTLNNGVTEVTAGTGIGAPAAGQKITTTGTINLLPATANSLGGVIPGSGLQVLPSGALNLAPPINNNLGGVKAGTGIQIDPTGVISAKGGKFTPLDDISSRFNGSVFRFQMSVQGGPYNPGTPTNLLVFVGGILQIPNVAYTVENTTLVFTQAPPAGTTFYAVTIT